MKKQNKKAIKSTFRAYVRSLNPVFYAPDGVLCVTPETETPLAPFFGEAIAKCYDHILTSDERHEEVRKADI